MLRTVHVRTVFPSPERAARVALYSESGRGNAGRSLFFILRHPTRPAAVGQSITEAYKSGEWEAPEGFLATLRDRVSLAESESDTPLDLALVMVDPPRMLLVARGAGVLGVDRGSGLGFHDVTDQTAESGGDAWGEWHYTPEVGHTFVLGFGDELAPMGETGLAALPALLERDSRVGPRGDVIRRLSDGGGSLIVGRFNHLPWQDTTRGAEAEEVAGRIPWPGPWGQRVAALAMLAVAVGAFVALAGSDPSSQGSAIDGQAAFTDPDQLSTPVWRRAFPAPAGHEPVAVGDLLMVACDDGVLRTLDPFSGTLVAERNGHGAPTCRPVFVSGLLVLAEGGGRLRAHEPGSGVDRWTLDLGAPVRALVADRERVWACVGPEVVCVHVGEGRIRWRRGVGAGPLVGLDVASGVAVVAAQSGKMLAFNPMTGSPRWDLDLGASPAGPPVIVKGRVHVVTHDGVAAGYDVRQGRRRWERDLALGVSTAPGCDGTHLYVGTDGGDVLALDLSDGSVAWQQTTGNRALGTLVLDGEFVIAIDRVGGVHGLRCDNGVVQFSRQLGKSMREPPVVTGGRVIAVTDEGDLEALAHQLFEPA